MKPTYFLALVALWLGWCGQGRSTITTQHNHATATSVTCAFTATAGATTVVFAREDSTSVSQTISSAIGDSYTQVTGANNVNSSGGNFRFSVWYVQNSVGGAETITISTSPTSLQQTCVTASYSGTDKPGAFDTSGVHNQHSQATYTVSMTTATNNELIVGAYADFQVNSGVAGTGYTNRVQEIDGSNSLAFLEDNAPPSNTAGTNTVTATNGHGGFFDAMLVGLAFKAGAGATCPHTLTLTGAGCS